MNFHIAQRCAIALALPLLLTACAGRPTQTAADKEVTAQRAYHDRIDLGGRLSVRYQSDRKNEALHGSFIWTQTPKQTTVTLLSPLGQTIAIIDVTPEGATLTQGGQPVRSAANVDALTADALGWPLPVASLRDWLQGFGLDANGRRFVATPQTADVITRDGWQIRYVNWQDQSTPLTPDRPKRIDLARTTEHAGDVFIRIMIDTWQVH